MVPDSLSRRAVLGGGGTAVAGSVTSSLLATTGNAQSNPSSLTQSTFTDWPLERYDPAGTSYNPDVSGPGERFREKWSTRISEFSGGFSLVSPVLVDDTLYAVNRGVAALDPADGATQFYRDGPYRSSPALATAEAYTTKTLVTAGSRGYVGLNARGGSTLLGRRFGLNRWYQRGQHPESTIFGPPTVAPPVVADGVVYVANTPTDRLAALDPSSGRELWSTVVARDGLGGQPGRPAVHDGTVYVTYYPAKTAAFDADTGKRRWQQDVAEGLVLPPTVTTDAVVVPDRSGVTALDPDDGSEQWRYDHGGNMTAGAAAVAEGTVFVTADTKERSLHAVDLETGEAVWQTADVANEAVPVVADGVVYVSAGGYDEVVALDAVSGAVHWRYQPDDVGPLGIPVLSDGHLFVAGSRDIYALEAGQ